MIRSAVSYSFARNVDPSKITTADDSNVLVTAADFELALEEIKPAFGVAEGTLNSEKPRAAGEITNYYLQSI